MILENVVYEEAKNELNNIKEIEKMVHRENLYHRTDKYTFNFRTISTFGRDIYNSKITTEEPDEDQRDSLVEILNFKKKAKSDTLEKKQEKRRCS